MDFLNSYIDTIDTFSVSTSYDTFMQELLKRLHNNSTSEFRSTFTLQIGNTICAFLNTIGGSIFIEYDEKNYDNQKVDFENNLMIICQNFNIDPSIWIKKDISKNDGFKCFILKVDSPHDGTIYSYYGKKYYRVGNKNKVLLSNDVNEIIRNRKKALGHSVLTNYVPTDKKKKLLFEAIKKKNQVSYLRLGQPSKNTSRFFKYCSLDIALSIFRKADKPSKKQKRNPPQTMRFVEPTYWDDQYEGRFYTADYRNVKRNPKATPRLYATCFTPREESEPAWQIYNRGKDGLGKRCVQFRLNQVSLRNELVKNLNNCTIVEGVVTYESKWFIDELHLKEKKDKSKNEEYEKYFSDFILDNFINLLLLKRTAYEHEKEVRIFIIDNDETGNKAKEKKDAKHKDVSLDWLSILEGIKVDSNCSDIEIKLLQDEINRLIDDSKRTKKDKRELKKKLKVEKYDVNIDKHQVPHLKIGETYAAYEKRRQTQNKAKKTAVKKPVVKKATTKKATIRKTATKKRVKTP